MLKGEQSPTNHWRLQWSGPAAPLTLPTQTHGSAIYVLGQPALPPSPPELTRQGARATMHPDGLVY